MMDLRRFRTLVVCIWSLHFASEIGAVPRFSGLLAESSLNHDSVTKLSESRVSRSVARNDQEPEQVSDKSDQTGLMVANGPGTLDGLQQYLDQVLNSAVFGKGSISRTRRATSDGSPNAPLNFPIKVIISQIMDGLANLIGLPSKATHSSKKSSYDIQEATPDIDVYGPLTWLTKYLITQLNAWYLINRYNCVWYEIGLTKNCAWFWVYKSIQLPIKWALEISFLPINVPAAIGYYMFFLPVLIPQWSFKSTLWGIRLIVVNLRSWWWTAKTLGKGSIIAAKVASDLIDQMWRSVMGLS